MVVKPVEDLVSILKEQVTEYRALLDLAKRKQQVLIGNDIKELDKLNKEEQTIIIRATKLENKRLGLISTLSEVLGSNVEAFTLKEITEKAPEPYQSELNVIYQELNEVVEELHKINKENSSLIEQALKLVNFTIESIVRYDREVVYSEKDPKGVKQLSRIFDSKA